MQINRRSDYPRKQRKLNSLALGRPLEGGARKAEEGDRWRERAADTEKWKRITAGAVQQYMT